MVARGAVAAAGGGARSAEQRHCLVLPKNAVDLVSVMADGRRMRDVCEVFGVVVAAVWVLQELRSAEVRRSVLAGLELVLVGLVVVAQAMGEPYCADDPGDNDLLGLL